MAKRANGEGTLRRRKDGTYEGRIFLGYNPETGKPMTKSVYAKTKKLALEKMESAKLNAVKSHTVNGMSGNTKLADWMRYWLETYTPHIKPCTHNEYDQEIRLRINPVLGRYALRELTLDMIQQAFNQQFLSGKASAKTISNAYAVLHKSLSIAVINGLIPRNVSDGFIRPRKPVDAKSSDDSSIVLMTNEEAAKFIAEMGNSTYGIFFMFLFYTGIRKGEGIGLQWRNVDLSKNEICICEQLYYDKDQHIYRLAEVKNSRPRTIALNQHAREILLRRQAAVDSHNLDGFVFTTSQGTHLCPTTLHKCFKRVAASIGKPNLRIHDLRHNFASMSLAAGVDIKSLQDTLGHATASFTLKQYAHTNMEVLHQAAEKNDDYYNAIVREHKD